ncbi:MAG: diphosphate--fructose-6-phosphate 1-phosphotransferase, partial [Victivallales bacterium]|nr:diphosphate--fructose-6-phosphate 1-phosphotransferase [Victivallales bacterium]
FPNTYGLPILTFENNEGPGSAKPIKAGVVLSGGQAPGGHNVIAGLYDGIKTISTENRLYGFLNGPGGLIDNKYIEITSEFLDEYRNTGGFDIIGSGRTKLETPEQFDKTAENCLALGINSIIIIGGDDSNTNACLLAEYFCTENIPIQVIGCPKTIDGDLKNEQIETSFGFDTACKLYAEMLGNLQRDANSAKKYWHFIKLMGRSASHITLECALQTHPNAALIGEEVAEQNKTLKQITDELANIIIERSEKGLNFGIVLVPEGLIEFIPEMKMLISELNDTIAEHSSSFEALCEDSEKLEYITGKLSPEAARVYLTLPMDIRKQLIMDRDPHGNVQVSRIETEKLLIELLEVRLRTWSAEGKYSGKFNALSHFFGYEGRCAAPSNFDADYCYSLGYTAAALLGAGKTGYMASIKNLSKPADKWIAGGIPITMMMNIERRHGKPKPVIQKALVELDKGPFRHFAEHREYWAEDNDYTYPGPIQYFGPSEICDCITRTLELEQQ